MTPREAEDVATRVLTGFGLEVEPVPTADHKTPDRAAKDPTGGRYTVEVKARYDDAKFASALRKQGFAMGDVPLDPSNSVANTLRKAGRQIQALSGDIESMSRLVFYVLAGGAFSTSLHAEQIRATLFGTILVNDPFDLAFGAQPCFYLGRSVFRDHPQIGGVILVDPAGFRLGLYPNSFANRDIRATFLGAKLAALNAVFSPEEAAQRGAGLLCDSPADAVFKERLRFVQKKYGRRFSPMRSAGWRAEMHV